MKTPSEPSGRPSLETLLRLKRSERPDSDFWDEFERGMKQKQLAAIVEPKPWWLGCSLLARKFAPLAGMGMAGGAALFVIVTLRTEMASGPSESVAGTPGQGAQTSLLETAGADTPDSSATRFATPSSKNADAILTNPSSVLLASAEAELGRNSQVNETERASASYAEVETLPEFTPEVVALGTSPGLDMGSLASVGSVPLSSPTVSAEEPFAYEVPKMDPVSVTVSEAVDASSGVADRDVVPFANPRQARLLAMVTEAESAADPRSLAHVRERVIHRMSEGESLYASISRLGVSGDRLSVKF